MRRGQLRLFRIDHAKPVGEAIDAATEAVRDGGIICYPTETVYGLGGNALFGDVIRAINRSKGRPESTSCINLILIEEANKWIGNFDRIAGFLHKFWPGPLTAIVEPHEDVGFPSESIGPVGGIAIRAASHPVNIAILESISMPLISTSANRSGESVPPLRLDGCLDWLEGFCDVVIDSGELPKSRPSTLVDARGFPNKIIILRDGAITSKTIRDEFPETEVDNAE